MTRERRRAHAKVFAVSVIGVPALIVAAVAVRPEMPPRAELGAELRGLAGAAEAPRAEPKRVKFGEHAVEVWEVSSSELVLRPVTEIFRPDIRVFWSPSGRMDEAVPAGSLAGETARSVRLPEEGPGWLILYSLGHGEVIGSAALGEIRGD